MAAVAPDRYLNPFFQLHQCITTIGSMLASVCERADSAFRHVAIQKTDEAGNIRSFPHQFTDENGQRTWGQITTLHYIEDIRTGDLYIDDSQYVVAVKCACLVFATPLYTLSKMGWYAGITPVKITACACDTLFKATNQFINGELYHGVRELSQGCFQILETTADGLFEVVKAPLFGLGMELSALYGVFKPYHGRKFEALIESAWHKGASYKQDIRHSPTHPPEGCWIDFVRDLNNPYPFFMAYCFQVRENVNNPRINVITRSAL